MENFKTILYDFKNWLGSFDWKVIVFTTKVRNETFRNGKRYEDKAYCLLSPLQSMGKLFFVKKALHEGTNFLGQIYGWCFTWRLMIRLCIREKLDPVKLVLLSLTLTWVIDILFEKLAPHIGDWIWNTSAHYASGVGDFI